MDVDRTGLLAGVLDDLAEGYAGRARHRLDQAWDDGTPTPVVVAALAAVTAFWQGDFAAAAEWSGRALAAAGEEPGVRALACAGAALAAAGDPGLDGGSPWAEGTTLLAASGAEDRWWSVVRHLLAEAALVSARVADARSLLTGATAPAEAWAGTPIATLMRACEVRAAAFSGEITEATALLEPLRASLLPGSRLAPVADAVAGLVLGNADDPDGVRRSIATSTGARHPDQAGRPAERDFPDRGALLLLAFGAVAVGDVAEAARLVFLAGDGGDLGACTVIDRALGFEMFLAAAIAEEDDAACETWLAALAPLAASPIAGPTVQRARARHLLATGAVDAAVAELEASIAACRRAGRAVEAAEGEIVLARARIAATDVTTANRALRSLVSTSDATGHLAVRRSAASTLQATGRRLPPVAGGGWAVLSQREREVASGILDGLDIAELAATLYLSPATVRSHVSRVLCAFGVPTRIGLVAAAAAAADQALTPAAPVAQLSPRQRQVAGLVAAGHSNQQIAEALEISVKGVEKHVKDVMSRWAARSRLDIARTWWASERERQPGVG